jgi:SOS-response transcriptional repressor LexA
MNLSPRQTDVYKYLIEFRNLFGYMPTTRDIQDKFKFASQTSAMQHLTAIEAKGYISRPKSGRKSKARAIVITRAL